MKGYVWGLRKKDNVWLFPFRGFYRGMLTAAACAMSTEQTWEMLKTRIGNRTERTVRANFPEGFSQIYL